MSTGGEANLILLWNTVVEIYIYIFFPTTLFFSSVAQKDSLSEKTFQI